MYLRKIVVENHGPLRNLEIELAFSSDRLPKPLVLVGVNGGGKTNFLSLVTDALFEAASRHYRNVLPSSAGGGRSWFRVVGGQTVTVGTTGGFCLLHFEHQGHSLTYVEKAGTVDPDLARERVPSDLATAINWPLESSIKSMELSDEQSREIFASGAYVYFPSSRSEIPSWLNRDSLPETNFEDFPHMAMVLRNPIYVERGLQKFKQWIMSVLLESRAEVSQVSADPPQYAFVTDPAPTNQARRTLDVCNSLLRRVLGREDVRFVWTGRNSPEKLSVAVQNELLIPTIDSLSGGQSIVLGLFGTLLRYADQAQSKPESEMSEVEGICVVDEIDAHLHVELQYKILPSLVKLFPRVQFILSSHSPLFVLGMQQSFGNSGFQLIEMPGGRTVTAETYAEFGKAMEALSATDHFNEELLSRSSKAGLPLILVEGETDAPYLRRAAELLGHSELLSRCEIEWIGAKDNAGQGFHTGKAALDHTLSVLRANPKLSVRPVLLLYDNDAKKQSADYGGVSVRSVPTNESNKRVEAGIENLLSESAITDGDYETTESKKPNGDVHTRRSLRKAALCERLCASGTSDDFNKFEPVLSMLQNYLESRP